MLEAGGGVRILSKGIRFSGDYSPSGPRKLGGRLACRWVMDGGWCDMMARAPPAVVVEEGGGRCVCGGGSSIEEISGRWGMRDAAARASLSERGGGGWGRGQRVVGDDARRDVLKGRWGGGFGKSEEEEETERLIAGSFKPAMDRPLV